MSTATTHEIDLTLLRVCDRPVVLMRWRDQAWLEPSVGECGIDVGGQIAALIHRARPAPAAQRDDRDLVAPTGQLADAALSLRNYGDLLSRLLLPPRTRAHLDRLARRALREHGTLLVRIRADAAFAQLPFEVCWWAREQSHLALKTTVVRALPERRFTAPLEALGPGPLRVLVVGAQPRGLPDARVDEEVSAVAALRLPGVEFEKICSGEPTRQRILQEGLASRSFHVLHFVGHGSFNRERDETVLHVVNEQGEADVAGSEEVRLLLRHLKGLRLVVLNACWGAYRRDGAPSSLAVDIFEREGIPGVVAMQFPIGIESAVRFAGAFYRRLVLGASIEDATLAARLHLHLHTSTSGLDWVVPTVFLATRSGNLFGLRLDAQHLAVHAWDQMRLRDWPAVMLAVEAIDSYHGADRDYVDVARAVRFAMAFCRQAQQVTAGLREGTLDATDARALLEEARAYDLSLLESTVDLLPPRRQSCAVAIAALVRALRALGDGNKAPLLGIRPTSDDPIETRILQAWAADDLQTISSTIAPIDEVLAEAAEALETGDTRLEVVRCAWQRAIRSALPQLRAAVTATMHDQIVQYADNEMRQPQPRIDLILQLLGIGMSVVEEVGYAWTREPRRGVAAALTRRIGVELARVEFESDLIGRLLRVVQHEFGTDTATAQEVERILESAEVDWVKRTLTRLERGQAPLSPLSWIAGNVHHGREFEYVVAYAIRAYTLDAVVASRLGTTRASPSAHQFLSRAEILVEHLAETRQAFFRDGVAAVREAVCLLDRAASVADDPGRYSILLELQPVYERLGQNPTFDPRRRVRELVENEDRWRFPFERVAVLRSAPVDPPRDREGASVDRANLVVRTSETHDSDLEKKTAAGEATAVTVSVRPSHKARALPDEDAVVSANIPFFYTRERIQASPSTDVLERSAVGGVHDLWKLLFARSVLIRPTTWWSASARPAVSRIVLSMAADRGSGRSDADTIDALPLGAVPEAYALAEAAAGADPNSSRDLRRIAQNLGDIIPRDVLAAIHTAVTAQTPDRDADWSIYLIAPPALQVLPFEALEMEPDNEGFPLALMPGVALMRTVEGAVRLGPSPRKGALRVVLVDRPGGRLASIVSAWRTPSIASVGYARAEEATVLPDEPDLLVVGAEALIADPTLASRIGTVPTLRAVIVLRNDRMRRDVCDAALAVVRAGAPLAVTLYDDARTFAPFMRHFSALLADGVAAVSAASGARRRIGSWAGWLACMIFVPAGSVLVAKEEFDRVVSHAEEAR